MSIVTNVCGAFGAYSAFSAFPVEEAAGGGVAENLPLGFEEDFDGFRLSPDETRLVRERGNSVLSLPSRTPTPGIPSPDGRGRSSSMFKTPGWVLTSEAPAVTDDSHMASVIFECYSSEGRMARGTKVELTIHSLGGRSGWKDWRGIAEKIDGLMHAIFNDSNSREDFLLGERVLTIRDGEILIDNALVHEDRTALVEETFYSDLEDLTGSTDIEITPIPLGSEERK